MLAFSLSVFRICASSFKAKVSAAKVGEVERDRNVFVSYAAPEDQRYVSMSGPARLLHDRAKIEEFWFADLETWFPGGVKDQELALLWISVTQDEYGRDHSVRLCFCRE